MNPTLVRLSLPALLCGCAAIEAAPPVEPVTSPPFTIAVRKAPVQGAPELQSFSFATSGGRWLMLGGRTNGFHRTSDRESTFPVREANELIHVFDPKSGESWSAPLPATLRARLRSTNQPHCQDGDTLYVVGGYGAASDDGAADSYRTFDHLTAIDVPALVRAVIAGDDDAIASAIVSIEDDRMRVTGGGLVKLGDWFYLVFGQNYDRIYKGAYVGKYTEEVRRFRVTRVDGGLAIADYQAFRDPNGGGAGSEYHRRDLNVCPGVRPDGSAGINVFSGVFTPQAGAWPHAITIDPTADGSPAIRVDATFEQRWTNYEAAHVLLYSPRTGRMFTTILGGISNFFYDKNGKPTPSNIDNHMPFVKVINTIAQDGAGVLSEHPQPPSRSLPEIVGANAVFVPSADVPRVPANHDVIDYDRIPAGDEILIGHMYGGILAAAGQASEFDPTFASGTVYEVFLQR